MGTVVIRCPETGKTVPVGFEAVRETFHAPENALATIHCPACGKLHQWQKRDAWVEPIERISKPGLSTP